MSPDVPPAACPARTIFFNTDWGHEWPLWEDDPDFAHDTHPGALGLSPLLTAALRDWYDRWVAEFHFGSGWSSANERDRLHADSDALVTRLADELGAGFAVENGFHRSFP